MNLNSLHMHRADACSRSVAQLWGPRQCPSPAPSRQLRSRIRANAEPDDIPQDLSPAARKIFKEAQENILALNKSRIRALQELKAANEKIAELERRLEDAGMQLSNISTRRAAAASTAAATPTDEAPHAHKQMKPYTPAATITLLYETGWTDAYLHFQVDDQPWTSLPGLKMDDGAGQGAAHKKTLTVPGARMEFVVTNGLGKFDTPNPYGEPNKPKNYLIESPGKYQLQSGCVIRLDE